MTKKGSIDQASLEAAALRVAKRVGFEGLTMRMVADELGVSAMAAYRHVPSREALIKLAADQLSSAVQIPDPDSGTWDERLMQVERSAFAARAAFPGSPDSAELAGGPEHDRLTNGVLNILSEAGLGDDDAAIAFQVIWAYFQGQLRVCEPLLQGRADGVELPAPTMPPALARVIGSVPAMSPEDFFEQGLEIFLDGLRARLAARAAVD